MQVCPEYDYKDPYEREAKRNLTTEEKLIGATMETSV